GRAGRKKIPCNFGRAGLDGTGSVATADTLVPGVVCAVVGASEEAGVAAMATGGRGAAGAGAAGCSTGAAAADFVVASDGGALEGVGGGDPGLAFATSVTGCASRAEAGVEPRLLITRQMMNPATATTRTTAT